MLEYKVTDPATGKEWTYAVSHAAEQIFLFVEPDLGSHASRANPVCYSFEQVVKNEKVVPNGIWGEIFNTIYPYSLTIDTN